MASPLPRAATRTLSVMLCPCDAQPRLYRLPQSEQPLLEDVVAQAQHLLHSLHPQCSAESFGMDDCFELWVSDRLAIFTLRAVLSTHQAESGLPRNEYVSNMMRHILGSGAPSVYGTVVWLVSYASEDKDGEDIDIVFDFDAPYVRSLSKLASEWKQGWANAQADGYGSAWSLRLLENMQ